MSHMMDNQFTILKRDARGRVRSSAEARAEAATEHRRSGLSATAFAKMAGISPRTLFGTGCEVRFGRELNGGGWAEIRVDWEEAAGR